MQVYTCARTDTQTVSPTLTHSLSRILSRFLLIHALIQSYTLMYSVTHSHSHPLSYTFPLPSSSPPTCTHVFPKLSLGKACPPLVLPFCSEHVGNLSLLTLDSGSRAQLLVVRM